MEAADVGLRELLVREVRQCRPAPQPDRRAQHLRPAFRIAVTKPPGSLFDEALEAPSVDRVRIRVELVARCSCRQDLAPSAEGLDGAAEIGDVDLDRMRGGPRGVLTPEDVDEPIVRHDLAGMQQQNREQGALLRRAELGDRTVGGHLERAQEPKVDRIRRHRRSPP